MTAPIDKAANGTGKVANAAGNATGLNKKIRGVPLWGWFVLVTTVGGGVFYFQKSRNLGNARTAAASATTEQGAGYTGVGYIAPTTVASTTAILTNAQWSTAAQALLIQKGHPPTVVAAAVQNFIANKQLDGNQQTLINEAIQGLGPLPQMSSGASNTISRIHTAEDGNLIGALVGAFGNVIGFNDPDNKVAPYLAPFLNNIIDNGPISGVFQSADDLMGGSANFDINPTIGLPGIGDIGLNLGASNSGLNAGGTLPQISIPGPNGVPIFSIGGGASGGIAPDSRDTFMGTWTVNDGDTLESISQELYGGTGGANIIYNNNLTKIPNPDKLKAGTVLKIPTVGSNA